MRQNPTDEAEIMPRKSKYDAYIAPRFDEIEAWARDGVSEEDMARRLQVAYSTFRTYKDKYPAFSALLTRTRDYVDLVEMVGAYKKRAMGYMVTETKKIYKTTVDSNGNEVQVLAEVQEIQKHVPGDPRAMENWLRVRQPDLWGHVQDTDEMRPVYITHEREELIESEVIEDADSEKKDKHE